MTTFYCTTSCTSEGVKSENSYGSFERECKSKWEPVSSSQLDFLYINNPYMYPHTGSTKIPCCCQYKKIHHISSASQSVFMRHGTVTTTQKLRILSPAKSFSYFGLEVESCEQIKCCKICSIQQMITTGKPRPWWGLKDICRENEHMILEWRNTENRSLPWLGLASRLHVSGGYCSFTRCQFDSQQTNKQMHAAGTGNIAEWCAQLCWSGSGRYGVQLHGGVLNAIELVWSPGGRTPMWL